jgi:hypothetical protein
MGPCAHRLASNSDLHLGVSEITTHQRLMWGKCGSSQARTLESTGPAYEAIQDFGKDEFVRNAIELARAQMRHGLVSRAEIKVAGFLAPEAPALEEEQQ